MTNETWNTHTSPMKEKTKILASNNIYYCRDHKISLWPWQFLQRHSLSAKSMARSNDINCNQRNNPAKLRPYKLQDTCIYYKVYLCSQTNTINFSTADTTKWRSVNLKSQRSVLCSQKFSTYFSKHNVFRVV